MYNLTSGGIRVLRLELGLGRQKYCSKFGTARGRLRFHGHRYSERKYSVWLYLQSESPLSAEEIFKVHSQRPTPY